MSQPQSTPLPLEYRNPMGVVARAYLVQWLNLFGTLLALLAIYGFFCILTPQTFLNSRTLETIARQTTTVGIAAMGMTLIIIAGGIDLSVGSIVAMVTVVVAWLLSRGYPPLLAALGGIIAGGACGFVNGGLVVALRVVPFIITLGTLLIFRSFGKDMAHEQKIDAPLTWLNDLLAALPPNQRWMLVPGGVWVMFFLVILTTLTLHFTRFGRHVVAIGSNEQTARLCGVPVVWTKLLVYILGGVAAGIAGVMQFSRLTVGDPTVAVGLELDVIAAVVIGGGSLAGGVGSPLGSLVGAAIMTTIRVGSSHMGWRNPFQEKITGIIIILAVALDTLRQRKTSRSD
jgi:ribose/xylose/arabinose/galactoside ABC-type transport system permease subunit